MNKIILIGNLGSDVEIKDAGTSKVGTVSLATKDSYKDKNGEWVNNTDWHTLEVWGALGEAFAKYGKGSTVAIEGTQKNSSYDDKDGVKRFTSKVLVTSFEILLKKEQGAAE